MGELAAKEQGGKQEVTSEKEGELHANGNAKHPSSKETTKSSSDHRSSTHKDDEKKKNGNVVGNTVNKVPGGSKVTDTTKAVGVDVNRDPTRDPHKVVDVGKVTSKGGEVLGGGREKVGEAGGRVGDVVGKVPVAGKVKGVAGGLLG